MKKVLIGVGIGCGVLVLMGVVAMVAGGIWLKGKAGDFVADATALQAQAEQASQLNERFPFTPPAEGEVLALDAERLARWVRVTEQSKELTAKIEENFAKASELGDGSQGTAVTIGAVTEHAKLAMASMKEAREHLLATLSQAEMSPLEYTHITKTLIATLPAEQLEQVRGGMDELQASLKQQRAEFEAKLADASTSAAERAAAEQGLASLTAAESSLPKSLEALGGTDGLSSKITAANAELVKPQQKQIDELKPAALLLMSLTGGPGEFGMQGAMNP